jgi:hypothetical protein
MAELTETQRRALADVISRSTGWDCGIPVPRNTANALIRKGLAEWAPPFWEYPKPVFTIRLTAAGRAALREDG